MKAKDVSEKPSAPAASTPRTGSAAQLMMSRDLVEIRDCGGTVIERKIVERVCGVVWIEKINDHAAPPNAPHELPPTKTP